MSVVIPFPGNKERPDARRPAAPRSVPAEDAEVASTAEYPYLATPATKALWWMTANDGGEDAWERALVFAQRAAELGDDAASRMLVYTHEPDSQIPNLLKYLRRHADLGDASLNCVWARRITKAVTEPREMRRRLSSSSCCLPAKAIPMPSFAWACSISSARGYRRTTRRPSIGFGKLRDAGAPWLRAAWDRH